MFSYSVKRTTKREYLKVKMQKTEIKCIYFFLIRWDIKNKKIKEETLLDKVTNTKAIISYTLERRSKKKSRQLIKSQVLLSGGE